MKMILKLVLISALLGFSVELEKGDIIRYSGHCSLYNHYAVYVGTNNELLPDQPKETDTFEMTKENSCVFGKLRDPHERFNYMDKDGPKHRTWEEMAKIITKIYKDGCKKWTFSNTCEHMATRIRYGDDHSKCMQYKTIVHPFCSIMEGAKTIKKLVQSKLQGRRRRSQKHLAAVYPAV